MVEVPSDAISSSYRVSTVASLSNMRYVRENESGIGIRSRSQEIRYPVSEAAESRLHAVLTSASAGLP